MHNEHETPADETIADKVLSAKLHREAQAREDLALVVPLAQRITTPSAEPRFVDGRWIS